MGRILPIAGLTLGLLAATAPAVAQRVTGTVVDDATGRGIAGATVLLEDRSGAEVARSATDDAGAFELVAARPGEARLVVSAEGYRTLEGDYMRLTAGAALTAAVRLGEDAIPLEPLVVRAPARQLTPDIAAFYDRLQRGRASGRGTFLDREDVSRSHAGRSTDLLRSIGGVQVARGRTGGGSVLRMRGGCVPAVFIDGAQINRHDRGQSLDDYVNPLSIEGIEVYRGPGVTVPPFHDPTGCGVVLVWTRRGERGEEGGGFRWRSLAIAGVIIAIMVLLY